MTKLYKLHLVYIVLGVGFAHPAIAQTATTTFDVSIQIEDECVIVSADDLNFGSVGALVNNTDSTSDLTVNCTEGASYVIALDEGLGGGGVSGRVMTNAADTVSYQLYTDAARATVWGIAPDDVSSTGTGVEQIFTVYGRVPPQNTPPAATYTDTIGVTITY